MRGAHFLDVLLLSFNLIPDRGEVAFGCKQRAGQLNFAAFQGPELRAQILGFPNFDGIGVGEQGLERGAMNKGGLAGESV